MKTTDMKTGFKKSVLPWVVCGVLWAGVTARAQYFPPSNGDLIGVLTSVSITNKTLSNVGTAIPIELRLWGHFMLTNTSVGPIAMPRLRMNLAAEEEAWATLEDPADVQRFTDGVGQKTRVTFKYRIREGDMVSKLKISGSDGSDVLGVPYGFDWCNDTWKIVRVSDPASNAVWRFRTTSPRYLELPGDDLTHYDFSYRSVGIKTLQFSSAPSPVQVGESVTWAVSTVNPVSSGRTVSFYVWVSNTVSQGDVNLNGVKSQKLMIAGGSTTATFQITGLTVGTNTVFLQGTQDYDNNASLGVQNAETRQIVVAPAPEPYVSVLLPNAPAPHNEQTLPETSAFGTGALQVRLSQVYTEDVWVRLDTTLNGGPQSNNVTFSETPKFVRVRAGNHNSDTVAFNVPDGIHASELFGITIMPVITNAAIDAVYSGESVPCIVKVANVAPVVQTPQNGATATAKRGTPQRFTWSVSDVAADLTGMTVTWDFGDGSALVTTNGYFGEIFHTYTSNGSREVKVFATDKDGKDSAVITMTVTVEDPVPAPKLSLLFSTGTTNTASYTETATPLTGWVRLVLSESFYESVQISLKALPDGQGNLLLGTTNLITIANGDLESGNIPFSLLDGTPDSSVNGITLDPVIVTPAASNYYTDVRQGTVRVQNVVPVIMEPVGYATVAEATTNAAVAPYDAIPMGRSFGFSWALDDVVADSSGLVLDWDFGDNTSQSVTNGLIGKVFHTYSSLGEKIVRLQVTDKDGGKTTRIAFKVNVVPPPPEPTVYVRPPAGYLTETTVMGSGSIDVELSEAFTEKVTVRLAVSPSASDTNGEILLATNLVEFRVGEVFKTVKVSARDGTVASEINGFTVTPSVIGTAAAINHYTELWPGEVQVVNADPVIRTPLDAPDSTTISYTIPQGTGWKFFWDVQDVPADLPGMKVTWYFGDGSSETLTGGSGSVTHTYNAPGIMSVRVVAKDKDGGSDEVNFKVEVRPAKSVIVTPIGPNLEANYWGAPGLGNGMVFSEEALGRINRNNTYFFTYGPGVSSAALRAVPYKTGPSGWYTVTNFNNEGVAIPGAQHHFDSFFYVWVGEDQGLPAQDLKPSQASPTTALTLPASAGGTESVDIRIIQAIFSREYRAADNCGDINQDGIPDKIAAQYNLPVIARGGTDGGGGAGSTDEMPVELTPVGDFNRDKDAAGNEVGDFLPGAASGGGAIIGGISNVFATVGDPFTAFLEVRGFHPGLNSALFNSDDDFGENETSRDCERPTNPTLQDTDGDLFPDGWEYYFWYNAKVNGVTGMAYTPTNIAVGTLIPTRTITTAFDPIVPATDSATGAAVNRDLDNDGLSDIEELTIGTNPIHWDTDGDGMCDGWEVMRGLNPNDSRDGLNAMMDNPDGDYMAYALVPRLLVTLENGVQVLAPAAAVVSAGEALGEIEGLTIPYRYGDDTAPIAVGRPATGLAEEVVGGVEPIDAVIVHNQVMQEFGFDPRTAWAGTVNPLSNPQRFPAWVAGLTAENVITAPNTRRFTSRDEYLLMKYMAELRLNGCTGAIGDGDAAVKTADWSIYSSHPKTPDSDVVWGDGGAVVKTDRMPDGWELYVSLPPGSEGTETDMLISPWDPYDGDWTFVGEDNLHNNREFHGTDCSAGYTNVALYGVYPGNTPVVTIVRPESDALWINKFWPSNPYAGDTDGDGLKDDAEMTFVYGTPVDNGTTCTPGGGLNPCSVDTDSDQLPDAWENAFAATATPVSPQATTNGMDGTVSDYREDWDRDGLLNYQEYWVQAVRSLRYDFTSNDIPMDGSAGASALFTPVTNAWDFSMYPFGDANPPLWILLPVGPAKLFVSCDPRDPDTDGDGMDDFYEMFHGLNPILGETALQEKGDRIREAYKDKGRYTIDCLDNAWGANLPFDFVTYPWLAGLDEADVDADGLRNFEEQLQPDTAAPACYNTDPSPLWLTDDSSPESVTARFYGFGGMFFWPGNNQTISRMYLTGYKMFSYEMNEGYDTDNDGVSDKAELMQTATTQSDPQDHDDPRRRQAIWFSGENSAAQSFSVAPVREYSLRSFTVELWACPERVDRHQVLIERPVIYPPSDSSTSGNVVRLNFRIGIKADGRVYAMFQNAGIHDQPTGVAEVSGRMLTANEWVHIAVRMDGQEGTLKLYLNDETPISEGTRLIPANGVVNTTVDPGSGQYPVPHYVFYRPATLVLGAANLNTLPDVTFPPWFEYAHFYQGYLDEVRIWDGARTDAEILNDYKRRYVKDDLLANRRAVRESEFAGGSRVPGVSPQLPPELLYHYTFDNLFGADNAESVAKVPRGFNYWETTVNRPEGYQVGWWSSLPTASTVYDDYGYVPWIENGVEHLPLFGGIIAEGTNMVVRDVNMVRNSFYWTHYGAGVSNTPPSVHGLERYAFPNSNDPYGYWYKTSLDILLLSGDAGHKGAADLLPLGGAFAKQAVVMWDNASPASVWADTGTDTDADGLPDWWEEYVATLGAEYENLGWYDLYPDGSGMTAGEAYMRDVARGYTASNNPAAEGWDPDALVRQTSDVDGDGLPDWWENLHNLNPSSALKQDGAAGDPDRDGLSNYAEYLISEVYGLRLSRPDRFKTSVTQTVSDYFVREGKLYYGEMFADHDFMEDAWEDGYSAQFVNRYVYDAHLDPDQDGWSNWSEARYGASDRRCNPGLGMYLNPEQESVKDFPVPVIETRLTYHGIHPVGNLIIHAFSTPSMDGAPDAIWRVQTSDSTAVNTIKHLGYWGARVIKGYLSPGSIVPGTMQIQMVDVYENPGFYPVNVSYDVGDTSGQTGSIMGIGAGGLVSKIGTIDYITGAYEIDLAWFAGMRLSRVVSPTLAIYANPENSYMKISYSSAQIMGWPKTLYLSDAETPTTTEPSLGYVKEGQNYFFAFLDLNGSGIWDAGEPCGVSDTHSVDIGYDRNIVNIELTDYTPGFLRMTF
ncbi:MAG TPA: PKD domain-containing protein, partial [Kiritimatiellia bacterium]|nr:PKD domain-containing protein [Kiritimatiellia bacterium]